MTDHLAAGDAARARLARVPQRADSQLLDIVAVIAKRLRDREPRLVADLSAAMVREIDHLDSDPKLIEMLEASVHGNLSTIIHVLANDIPVDHLQPTTAAVEYALRLAQRDVPSNSLVRAYHLGQNSVMLVCYQMIEDLDLDAATAMAVTRHVSDVLFGYIDWITHYVFQAYENERRRWINAEGNVLSSTIHRLLDDADADPREFEAETGHRLDQYHLAVILWTDDTGSELRILDRVTRELAVRLRAESPPTVTAIDRNTVWAWLALGRRGQIDDVRGELERPPGVGVAVGVPGQGLTGFRRSHIQARAAYAVATMSAGTGPTAVGYTDRGVAVAAMLAEDLDATRCWVQEVLGELAEDSPAAAVLRDTLSAFFATHESHVRTAELLNLHRNTVKYRIGKALSAAPVGADSLDLALALTVCELLGPALLKPVT